MFKLIRSIAAAGALLAIGVAPAQAHGEVASAPHCWPDRPLAQWVADWTTMNRDNDAPEDDVTAVVVAGTVTADLGIVDDAGSVSYRVAVEQWFPGPDGYSEVGIRVSQAPDANPTTLRVGERLVIAGGMQGDAIGFVDCLPHAELGTSEGDELLAEARGIFGDPVTPAADRRLPVNDGSGFQLAMLLQLIFMTPIWIVLLAVVVLVLIGVAVAVQRGGASGRGD